MAKVLRTYIAIQCQHITDSQMKRTLGAHISCTTAQTVLMQHKYCATRFRHYSCRRVFLLLQRCRIFVFKHPLPRTRGSCCSFFHEANVLQSTRIRRCYRYCMAQGLEINPNSLTITGRTHRLARTTVSAYIVRDSIC